MPKITTILADHHTLIRECLWAIMEKSPELELVGQAASSCEAVRLAVELKPDLVLMDADINGDGMEAVRRIVSDCPGTRVLILSMQPDRHLREAMTAGAGGFLLKSCTSRELVCAIKTVAGNEGYLSPELNCMVEQGGRKSSSRQRSEEGLTPRELEILTLLAQGKSSRDIAGLLQISVKTVETHRTHVMKKLKITNIASLTKYAIRQGILPLD